MNIIARAVFSYFFFSLAHSTIFLNQVFFFIFCFCFDYFNVLTCMRCEGNLMNSTNLNTKEQIIICGFKKYIYKLTKEMEAHLNVNQHFKIEKCMSSRISFIFIRILIVGVRHWYISWIQFSYFVFFFSFIFIHIYRSFIHLSSASTI